jgi:hypothetical protein
MNAISLLAMAATLGPAPLAVGPGDLAGIPAARSAQQWGSVVMETLQADIRIEPIRAAELASPAQTFAGAANATAMALGPAHLGADFALQAQAVNPWVTRDLNRVWRLTLPADRGQRSRVTTTVESLRGEAGRLSLVGHEEVSIPVLVLERPSTVQHAPSGVRVIEGGVALQVPSASLRHAGQYAGRLIVRTEGY